MNKKLKTTELNRISVDDFKKSEKLPLVILIDNVRSGNNIGSIFRTADAFRLEEIVLCGISATPPNKDILKTALGSTETVHWRYEKEAIKVLQEYKNNGYKVAAIEQAEQTTFLQDWQTKADEKWLIIVGNEIKGVQQDLIDGSDTCIEIPQFGTKHSINVAVCTGQVVWEYARERLSTLV